MEKRGWKGKGRGKVGEVGEWRRRIGGRGGGEMVKRESEGKGGWRKLGEGDMGRETEGGGEMGERKGGEGKMVWRSRWDGKWGRELGEGKRGKVE